MNRRKRFTVSKKLNKLCVALDSFDEVESA